MFQSEIYLYFVRHCCYTRRGMRVDIKRYISLPNNRQFLSRKFIAISHLWYIQRSYITTFSCIPISYQANVSYARTKFHKKPSAQVQGARMSCKLLLRRHKPSRHFCHNAVRFHWIFGAGSWNKWCPHHLTATHRTARHKRFPSFPQ